MSVDVAIRLGLQGGKEVQKTFEEIGAHGSRDLKELREAANDLHPALRAVSVGVAGVKDKIEELHEETGTLGKIAGSFGRVGIAAAIGVAAIAEFGHEMVEQARAAAEYADNIERTAKLAGTTTDKLQEMQYAIVATGGKAEEAGPALEAFNAKLGQAASGLSAKSLKVFTALGFTKEELKDVKDGADLLPELADRISKLGSTAAQNAVIDKLGLRPFAPLLREGKEAMLELMHQAELNGAVMSEEFIKKGAEANIQFELIARTIKTQLTTAFVNLAPIVTWMMRQLADTSDWVNKLINGPSWQDTLVKQHKEIADLDNQYIALTERAAAIRNGKANSATLPFPAQSREDNAANIEREAAAVRRKADALIHAAKATDELHDKEKKRAEDEAKKNAGTSLIDPNAAKDAKAAADKAAREAKAAAAARAQAVAEYSRLIESSMDVEAKAAAELTDKLAKLAEVGAKAGKSAAEIARDQDAATAAFHRAKLAREEKADDKDVDQFDKWNKEADAKAKTAVDGVKKYSNDDLHPDAEYQREVDALNAARDAAKGLKGEMTDGEYENALKKIEDHYVSLKKAIGDATVEGQLMTAVLNGQVKSWSDLGNVAIKILTDIITKAATMTAYGHGGGGSFFDNLLSVGAQALGGFFGGGGGAGAFTRITGDSVTPLGLSNAGPVDITPQTLPTIGRATGGPIYAGDTRDVGERGRERITATSDGYVSDAATTAAAMAAQRPPPRGGASAPYGDGGVNVVLNNGSGTPMAATARRTTDDRGRGTVQIDLVELADQRINGRFDQMIDGKRDDMRLAAAFGQRRRLSG